MSALAVAEMQERAQIQAWRCPGCNRVLGLIDGRRVRIKHQKRQIDVPLPPGEHASQVCDNCGALATVYGEPEPR